MNYQYFRCPMPVGLRTPKLVRSSRRRQWGPTEAKWHPSTTADSQFLLQHSTSQYHTYVLLPVGFPFYPIPPSRLALHFSPNALLESSIKGHYTQIQWFYLKTREINLLHHAKKKKRGNHKCYKPSSVTQKLYKLCRRLRLGNTIPQSYYWCCFGEKPIKV